MQKFIAKLIEAEWDQKQSSKGILQKGALRNFAKFSWKRLFSCELFKIYKNTFFRRMPLDDWEKETLTQVFSCEFGKISKNTFFHRTKQNFFRTKLRDLLYLFNSI